jgi:hypothetical protein
VISSPAPAVTYSQAIAGIFAFANASKSAKQMGSAPDAAIACEIGFDSSVIILALRNQRIPRPLNPRVVRA